jgi:hypothetical protein
MNDKLSLDEVTSIVLSCHKSRYDSGLPPTAYNKILFLLNEDLKGKPGIDVDIPLFWYMHGPVVKTAGSSVTKTQTSAGQRIRCDHTETEIDAESYSIRKVRESAKDILEMYYENSTDGLISKAYEYAPYEVGQVYRDLKRQLATEADSEQTALGDFTGGNQSQVRKVVHNFVDLFPVTEFPELENELHIWYRLVSAKLDADEYDPGAIEKVTKEFWRMFCLELACRENNGLSREDIETELDGVSVSITAEKDRHREYLQSKERNKANRNATGSDLALKASEGVVLPHLDFDVRI